MNNIKIEIDMDYFSYNNSCFICLEQVVIQNNGEKSLLRSFFRYLKISEFDQSVVCKRCIEILAKFAKLSNTLEKVRLEMDYFLELIQSSVYCSNKNLKSAHAGFKDVREAVVKNCQEKIYNPRPQLILDRITYTTTPSRITECASDLSPYFDCDSNSNESNQTDCPATPVIKKIKSVKLETGMTTAATASEKRPCTKRKLKAKCPECPFITSKVYLKEHIERVHLGLKFFKCSTCLKPFGSRHALTEHIDAIHLNLKPYKCNVCDVSFRYRKSLQRHQAKGHRPKECSKPALFPCPTCNKMFTTPGIVRTHFAAVHEKQKHPCQVPGCGKVYSRDYGLVEHYKQKHPNFTVPRKYPRDYSKKTVNGVNVFECKFCTSNFQTVDEVKSHVMEMHKSSKFLCVYCGFQTIRKGSLQRHLKAMHKKEEKNEVKESVKIESNGINYDYILP